MSGLSTWIVEPIDPVLFGDGRPFTAAPGSRASSLLLPPPSTLAGGLRSRCGRDGTGRFDSTRIEALRALRSLGPLPVLLGEDGEIADWLFPAPADAVELEGPPEGRPRQLRALRPLALPAGGWVPRGDCAPVGMPRPDRRKPYKASRPLWRWGGAMRDWLVAAEDRPVPEGGLGVPGPSPEPRMHVSIDPETGTARDGALFSVEARAWRLRGPEGDYRLAMALLTDADPGSGSDQLGGERRFVRWAASGEAFPGCPEAVIQSIRERGAARLILATPAHFEAGDIPRRLLEHPAVEGLAAKAHGRCQVISGWDMAARGGRGAPKGTRRLMPAGAVLYLRLSGDADRDEAWARETWARPISDAEQSRRDGFGIALLGSWSGELAPIDLRGE